MCDSHTKWSVADSAEPGSRKGNDSSSSSNNSNSLNNNNNNKKYW